MSTIATTGSSPSEALLSLLNSSANAKTSSAPSGADQSATTSIESPATQVELSDRAKAVLARDKFDRVAADRLAQFVAAGKGKDSGKSASAIDDGSSLTDS